MKKYISTTLPYINSQPHIGHCFEFVLADVLAEYHRLHDDNVVFFNVGIDEHGAKVHKKALDEGYTNTQEYCDIFADKWKEFCELLKINYDNFYRTTDTKHKENVLKFYHEIQEYIYVKEYEGKYCVGCESFITEKDISSDNKCVIHKSDLVLTKETNKFFDLDKIKNIKNILVDKSKSTELENIINDKFDLSITRENVEWGVRVDDAVFYVWFEALLNYIFSIGYYDDIEKFKDYWENSLIICGKDNLKFQAYILQALLISNNIPQTKEVLVHGNILDSDGIKMSKSLGNVIDPLEQLSTYGLDPLRYYLTCGVNVLGDSKYSEADLIIKWNNDIVNGLGNLISRLLHLVDTRNVILNENDISNKTKIVSNISDITKAFNEYDLKEVGNTLNKIISDLNYRITNEKPYDKNCENYSDILNEIYYELKSIIPFYKIILKENANSLDNAFINNKKTIIFNKL